MRHYEWTCVTSDAAFAPRDGAGALVFRDTMWLLGGWSPNDAQNFPRITNSEVWSSTNGKNWTLVQQEAPWEGRHTAGYVVHRDAMWIVGGDCNRGHYQNDVWRTGDGLHWNRVCAHVPWADRALHHTVTFQDKIWVIGGQRMPAFTDDPREALYSDVWNSEDGAHWCRVADHLPWGPRGMIGGQAVFKDRIWLLGGGTYDTPKHPRRMAYHDVWSTPDGMHWKREWDSAPWKPRQYLDVAVFDECLWVVAGHHLEDGNLNDVWFSEDGTHWTMIPTTPWAPRHATSLFVFQNALWVVAGNNMTSDVWKLERKMSGGRGGSATPDRNATMQSGGAQFRMPESTEL